MAVNTVEKAKTEKVAYSRLWWVTLLAAAVSVVINVILFYIAAALGWMPQSVITPTGLPITVVPVILTSALGAIFAGIGVAILNLFLRRPLFIFNILAIIVFILMFFNPFSLPKAPVGMIVTLELMHVVVVAAIIILFDSLARKPQA